MSSLSLRASGCAWHVELVMSVYPLQETPKIAPALRRLLPRRHRPSRASDDVGLGPVPRTERVPQPGAAEPKARPTLTVLIPAYNEAASIADTLESIRRQTQRPDHVIVIDDCSKDGTGEIARACSGPDLVVTVVRPEKNRGCKASALNYGLDFVTDELTLAIDADTTLAPDAIEKLLPAMDSPRVGAACGMVIPRHVRSLWERGRYIEYLYAFGFYKPIQDYYERPMIASGCFAMFRTAWLKEQRGWPTRTVGEDMDLTWQVYIGKQTVRFVPEAVCYPIEPPTFDFLRKQLTRWSHGFVQCVRVNWQGILEVPYLRMMVAVALWDATFAAAAYLIALPLLAITVHPLFLLAYLLDLPALLVPVLAKAWPRGEVKQALLSLPAFYVIRFVNFYFVFKAFWDELVVQRRLKTFEKGH